MMLTCQTNIMKCSAAASKESPNGVTHFFSSKRGLFEKAYRLSRGAAFANCKD